MVLWDLCWLGVTRRLYFRCLLSVNAASLSLMTSPSEEETSFKPITAGHASVTAMRIPVTTMVPWTLPLENTSVVEVESVTAVSTTPQVLLHSGKWKEMGCLLKYICLRSVFNNSYFFPFSFNYYFYIIIFVFNQCFFLTVNNFCFFVLITNVS